MTAEQIQGARAESWRQKSDPILTLDDAQGWLAKAGLCLFVPRRAQIAAPAPSFVEACLGAPEPTPPRMAIESAIELLVRMVDTGSAIPLNLLGTPGEQPDFLATPETLPYIFALRGEKDWKREPHTQGAGRVSPLVLEVWKLLEQKGGLTAGDIKDVLGREVTEAAVLRALHELWEHLRVVPGIRAGGEAAVWEPLALRYRKALEVGANLSQITALSVLVSTYLQSAVAASGEEAEAFLSPLASRSRVREVIRGLTATRQLMLLPLESQTLLYVDGTLPEFEELPVAETPGAVKSSTPLTPEERRQAPIFARPEKAPARPRRFAPRDEHAGAPREAGAKKPWKPKSQEDRPAWKRPAAGGERPARGGSDRPSRGGERQPWKPAARPGFGGARSDRPFAGKREAAGEGSERRPWQDRGEKPRSTFKREDRGGKPAFKPGFKSKFKDEGKGEYKARPKAGFKRGPGAGSKSGSFAKRPFAPRSDDRPAASEGRPRKEWQKEARPGGFSPPRRSGSFGRPRSPESAERGARRTEGFDRAARPGAPDRVQGSRSGERPPRSFDRGQRPGTGSRPASGPGRRPPFAGARGPGRPDSAQTGGKPFRKPGARFGSAGARKPFVKSDRPRSTEGAPREGAADAGASRPWQKREAPDRPARKFGSKPAFGGKPGSFGGKPKSGFSKPGGRPPAKFGSKFAGKPAGKFGGKPGGKFGGKPGGKFGAKPGGKFGARPAGRSGAPNSASGSGPASKPRKPRPESDSGASSE